MANKANQLRSHCPINFGIELFGDKWSLLIIRDIVFWGKKTHTEFMQSREGIATNILGDRLAMLEREGILSKTPHPTDGRKELFALTKKGLALIPILLEIIVWSGMFDTQTDANKTLLSKIKHQKTHVLRQVTAAAKRGEPVLIQTASNAVAFAPSIKSKIQNT